MAAIHAYVITYGHERAKIVSAETIFDSDPVTRIW
jgi:hypothetical protein